MEKKKVYILILNWNSWQDTTECIKSVLSSDFKNFQLVVIDNASQDSSVTHIVEYLKKREVSFIVYSEEEAIQGGKPEKEVFENVIIIRNKGNYGFAKGNNTALRFILKRGDFGFVWLLNNDAVADPKALSNLIKVAEKDKRIGFVGSVIRYYDSPSYIQAVGGGKFYPLLGAGKLYMKNRHISIVENLNPQKVSKHLDYIMGASLLVRREVLEEVGIFDESYFLYTEELDLITRGRKKGWKLAVAFDSYIYHKESASTKNKRWLYYYHLNRSNIIYIKKHFGIHYALVSAPLAMLNTIRLTRRWRNIKAAAKGLMDGIRNNGI